MRRSKYTKKGPEEAGTFTVEELMQSAVITTNPHTTGLTIAHMLSEGNFGSIPVIDTDRRLLGLVSEYDLLQAVHEGKDLFEVTADPLMSRSLITVTEETSVSDLIRLLQEHHALRVPVVRGETLVGIVARRDVLFGYVQAMGNYWP